jgi:hypothetical protein
MSATAPAPQRTITLFQNKRIAVGERHNVDLAEFLSSPARVTCGDSPAELKRAKESKGLWSPGSFVNDHRSRKTIESIFALGFDLDEEPVVTFDLACTKLEFIAGHLTTSFRHRIDSPRLRLIVSLSRLVNAEEYDRLWLIIERRISSLGFGIGSAAKDPSRGWFVPSTPNLPGYEYRHAELHGNAIDVDAELANEEIREERESEREHVPRRAAKGILERAHLYVETWDPAIEGSGGSNVAFAHIERLVRGFDLTDDDALSVLAGWNRRCKPPWSKKELLHKIADGREKGDTAWGELRDVIPIRSGVPQPTGESGITLIYDKGAPAKIAMNVVRMIAKYPRGQTKYNEFTDRITWNDGKPIKDTDCVDIQGWLVEQPESVRVRVSVETIQLSLVRYAEDHGYHPVREYLRSLAWDTEERIERLFTRAFGAPDDDYTRQVSKCFMIAAVARIMKPGCKHDAMPVLEGAPGLLKSTALRTLAGDDWFSDTPITPGDKDAYQSLIGVWIYEHAELSNIRGREAERVNAYMSSAKDHYRKSYGRVAEDVHRQSVFAGTTNSKDYISSNESDGQRRRFWPVPCTKIDVSLIRDYRDQLWAEAVAMYDAHHRWWLPHEVHAHHAELTEERHSPDPWIERIALLEPKEHTMGEVLGLCGVDPGKRSVIDEKRVSPLLKKAGWHSTQARRGGVRIRFWVPPGFAGT